MHVALLIASLLASTSEPATPPADPMPAPPPCSSAEYREFDFWLGQWEVSGGPKMDTVVGSNRIEKVSSGCALAEHWVNANGRDGRSLNVYEATTGQWTQFWIGSDGVVLRLSGGREGRDMLLRGALSGKGGGEQLQRIRWSPRDDGSVVQRWDTSDDDGASWQTSFLGHYRPVND